MTAVEQALADQVRVRTYLEEQAAEVEGLIVRMAPAMQESYREKSRPHLALAAFESELARLRAEVKRLTEAQNRLEQGWADATADVERLTREREGYLRDFLTARERAEAAEAEVERLTRERDEARDALDARETWQERFRAAEAVAASYRQALESLVAEVELNAARKATAAGLGASEWEAFIAESVYQALKVARAALASSAEAGTPARCPCADFYRATRTMWCERYVAATNIEEREEASTDAMDSLYAYYLAHGLIEPDAGAGS